MEHLSPIRSSHHIGSIRYILMWLASLTILSATPSLQGRRSSTEVNAFCVQPAPSSPAGNNRMLYQRRLISHLYMASSKSLNNKQAALRQKMEQAKRQNEKEPESLKSLTDEEIRQRNDRLRFEELLQKGAAAINSSDGEYLSRRQEEDLIDAVRAGKDLLFEGDAAPTDCFEELVSIKSENAIGVTGKQRLVPWLHKNSARHEDYVVVLTDPRRQSVELRETVKGIVTDLPKDVQNKLIVINADSPAENRRWLKKSGLMSNTGDLQQPTLDVYSDEKMEWMRSYTALGDKRWSMTMFVLASGKIQKLAREVNQYDATKTIQNAVKAFLEEARLSSSMKNPRS